MATRPIDSEEALLAEAQRVETESAAMDDTELASLLAAHEAAAVGQFNSEIAGEQEKAINYYYGKMDDLPALDGCSSVVDNVVQVHVDNGLAAILKPFVSADEVVMFSPRGPEDVEQAEQATEYVNYVINCDNDGFLILHDWFKDALLTKLGIVKVWWEDQTRNEVKQIPLDAAGLLQARNDPSYLGEQEVQPGVFVANLQQMIADGRVKIENVPPEEFLISPLARSIETCPYVAHRPSNFTRSDLIEMGVDQATVDSLPAASEQANNDSVSQARYRDEDFGSGNRSNALSDKSRDVVAVLDEYVRVDYDGDGVSELRRVVRVDDVILLNEEVDEAPFALLCPVPMPHKVYGRSVADLALEGQKVSTAVLRQTLDNLYKSNNPRPEVPDTAVNESTWDDLGDSSPGAAIRTRQPGQLQFFVTPFSADKSFAMLEAIATNVEERTGVQRKGNGLNPETLKKNSPDTATQASIDENSRNERAEMVARIFAETGVKRLFKLILNLLQQHQPKERVIRLRNQWVEMDPRGWPEMDVAINVGLGVGNKGEQIGQAQSVLSVMQELGTTPFGYLLQPQHVHKAVKRLLTASGIKDADQYIGDPAQLQAPPQQQDPKMVEAQAKLEIEQAKMQAKQQADAASMQLDMAKAQAKQQMEQEQAMARIMLEREKLAGEQQLASQRAQFEAQLAAAKFDFEKRLAAAELQANAAIQQQRADDDAEIKKNRPGGKLDQ